MIELSENADFDHSDWLARCKKIQKDFEPLDADYPDDNFSINPYHLIPECFKAAEDNSIFVAANATACIVPFQRGEIKKGQRLFSNSGSASMGYDLPAAIGAAKAAPNKSIICFAGDGSIMMNLQELQTIIYENLNICIVILENDGYLSIKQTQTNFFKKEFGASPGSGVSFPNFRNVLHAFGFSGVELKIDAWRAQLKATLDINGPRFIVAHLNRHQEFEPRLKSRMVHGVIQTPELDDMFPFLDPKKLAEVRRFLAKG
jgi:acetolactate synthase-1/2/3 large subunit